MRQRAATLLLCMLLCMFPGAFTAHGEQPRGTTPPPDSLRSLYLYTDALKRLLIERDSTRARELCREALKSDSTCAPAYYTLAVNGLYDTPGEGVELARRAWGLDTTNKWYARLYGQTLIYDNRFGEALDIYRRLLRDEPREPDNYRIVAALYEQVERPFSALATLDSAEVRFGRVPTLSAMKRQLLIATRQLDKAVEEARTMVEEVPYEAEHHAVLANLYGLQGKDSLARAEFDRALEIDSTDIRTLMTLADFCNSRRDYIGLLAATRRIFDTDALTVDEKVRRFRQLTSDIRFYGEYYIQISDLASALAIRYPNDPRIVRLYADHLIASGELEQALALYKLHTADRPPVKDYFRAVAEIENYLERPDSVQKYVAMGIELFPDDADFRIFRGHALSYAKQYDKSVKAYRESLRYVCTDSLRSVVWGCIGDAYHSAGASRKCFAAYEKSLRYWPDNTMVLNNYAYFLAERERDLEKALTMVSRVTALTDNEPTYLDTEAWILFKLGRVAEAKKIMQQAIALDRTNSPELQLHYGDILEALGEHFMAEIYWRKAPENGAEPEEGDRRSRIRQFLSLNYTQGWNRLSGSDESIRFTDENGLQALKEHVIGTNRMILNTETVLFSPYHPLGFRIAFFGFADFGLIGYSPNIFKNEFYTSLGIGVRLRNERLVFNTIQIRLGIAFGKPGLVESEYFRLSNATRLEQWRYRPTRPEIVTFE